MMETFIGQNKKNTRINQSRQPIYMTCLPACTAHDYLLNTISETFVDLISPLKKKALYAHLQNLKKKQILDRNHIIAYIVGTYFRECYNTDILDFR